MTKSIEEELALINFFKNTKNELINTDNYQYFLYREDKKYFISSNKSINTNSSKLRFECVNNIIFAIGEYKIKISSSQLKSTDVNKTIYSVGKFHSEFFDKNKQFTYKLVIPCDKKNKIHYNDYFSLMNFMISINGTLFSGIEFKINNLNFQMYHLNNHFIIETTDTVLFNDFDKYCRLSLASFGLITGSVCMEQGYYFGYTNDKKNVQFLFDSSFYSTYKTQYNLITTNAYEYYQSIDLNFNFDENGFKTDERIDKLNKDLKPIERNIFEALVAKMIENTKFSEIIFSIISINNLKSFSSFLKAGLYTIVLEMITSIIKNQESYIQEDILKEENTKTKEKLQKKLHEIAKTIFEENKLKYEDSIVQKRLNGIYAPINTDKLTEAYNILQIPLTEEDKKNIKLRNKFLHGSSPYKDKDLKLLSKKLFYINLELNYLVNALVFKYVGYDGVLKNLAKIYLDYSNLSELKEQEYYKTLSKKDNKFLEKNIWYY